VSGATLYAYVGSDPLSHTDPLGLFLWPWESPVMIYGGTPAEQAQVEAAVNQVLSTPRGQEMLAQIDGPWYDHGNAQELYINDDGQNESPSLGSGELYVDPDSHVPIPTANGRIFASLTRIIAHELGHSLMCDDDDGPGRMNNVNKNENPVVNALGQPSRTSY
jgi:hypothetical protein